MPDPIDQNVDKRGLLSALADGETDAGECALGCESWADPDAAARWHAYHLIGDVLRCEDLARAPHRDAAFLARLRAQLAGEPVALPADPPVAPPATVTELRPRRSWLLPVAMAAGLAMLGTMLVVTQGVGDAPTPVPLAAAPGDARTVAAGTSLPLPESVEVGGKLVRDAQLDRDLRAHREYGAASPGSLPRGAGRSVEAVSFQR
jgi:sigma-E factor negative regulatory protein RseA